VRFTSGGGDQVLDLDATRIRAAEMKYLRRTAGYAWTDHKTNTDIAKELNIAQILDKIQDHSRK
jgi:ABC-type ATPase involved in cell division